MTTKSQLDAEFDEELAHHLEEQRSRNIKAGMSPDEALRRAKISLGGVEQIRELHRETRGVKWLEDVFRDGRLAIRSLRRAPGFTGAVVGTLALCFGPNVAILTLLYALVLKPQPFHEPDRLVQVVNAFDKVPGGTARQVSSAPQFRDFREQASLFDGLAVMQYFGTTIGEDSTPERGTGMRVDAGFFPLFRVKPLVGRFGAVDEDAVGRDHVLVLTETFWRARYGGNPNVIGKIIRMGGEPWTIIGVAPKNIEGLDPYTMFFKPFERVESEENPRTRYRGRAIVYGRIKSGVALKAAEAELANIEHRYLEERASPQERTQLENTGHHIVLEPIGQQQAVALRSPLSLLQAGAAFVLLIGLLNVLNLLLARGNARRPELAIRLALGGSAGAVLRLIVTETMILCGLAAVLGLGLAWGSLRTINHYLPLLAAKALPVSLEPAVVLSILIASLLLALILGAAQFGMLWRSGLRLTESRTTSAGTRARVFRDSLVVVQVAAALLLLIGAGLLTRSFVRVMAVDMGFDPTRIVTGRVAVPRGHEQAEKNVALQRRIADAFKQIPGVDAVSLVSDYSLGKLRTAPFVLKGAAVNQGESQPITAVNWVSPDYFSTMGMPLLEGRLLNDGDDIKHGLVVVVDDLFAKRYSPGGSIVGHEINFGTEPPAANVPWPTVVGVVRRAQLAGPEERDRLPVVFGPLIQQPMPGLTFLVRSQRDGPDMLAAMRQKLREIDPTMPLYWAASLRQVIDEMLQSRRGLLLLIGAFAVLALLLAAVGLYGLLAYDVSQRTREIGIRAAIGARPGQLIAMVVREGMWKTGIGVVIGLGVSAYASRFLAKLLFETATLDVVTFVGVPLLMLSIAAVACWLPACRASKTNPVLAIRAD